MPHPDLVGRLTEAAGRAIASERPALLRGPGKVRGLTVELAISSDGQVTECVAYVERRVPFAKLVRWDPDAS